MEATKDQSLN